MVFNFLALPREIRDLIYAYVVEDVKYRHAFVTNADPYSARPSYGNIVRVTHKNAPSINLLLSHAQLCHEYKYATRSLRRSTRIRLDTLMTFYTQSSADGLITRLLKLYKPTTLTVVIHDWSKGMDPSFSFHDAKERFWDVLGMITYYLRNSLRSVETVMIAIKEKDCCLSDEVRLSSLEDRIAPRGLFLCNPHKGRSPGYLLDASEDWLSQFLLLKECRQASRSVSAPCGRKIAVARVTCLVYTLGSAKPQAGWDIAEVNELWPRTSLQSDLWTWDANDNADVA